jgi:hypothetical protein
MGIYLFDTQTDNCSISVNIYSSFVNICSIYMRKYTILFIRALACRASSLPEDARQGFLCRALLSRAHGKLFFYNFIKFINIIK